MNNSTIDPDELLLLINNEKSALLLPAVIYVSVLMVTGLLGNLMVCYFYGRQAKTTPSTIFIIALGIYDLTVCSIFMPTEIVDMVKFYTFDNGVTCKMLRFVNFFTGIGSILTLLAIAVDRYKHICKANSQQITLQGTKVICVLVIVATVFLSWPSLLIYDSLPIDVPNEYGVNLTGTNCMLTSQPSYRPYVWAFNAVQIVCFIMFTTILVILYGIIGQTIYQHRQRMSRYRSSVRMTPLEDGDTYNTADSMTTIQDIRGTSNSELDNDVVVSMTTIQDMEASSNTTASIATKEDPGCDGSNSVENDNTGIMTTEENDSQINNTEENDDQTNRIEENDSQTKSTEENESQMNRTEENDKHTIRIEENDNQTKRSQENDNQTKRSEENHLTSNKNTHEPHHQRQDSHRESTDLPGPSGQTITSMQEESSGNHGNQTDNNHLKSTYELLNNLLKDEFENKSISSLPKIRNKQLDLRTRSIGQGRNTTNIDGINNHPKYNVENERISSPRMRNKHLRTRTRSGGQSSRSQGRGDTINFDRETVQVTLVMIAVTVLFIVSLLPYLCLTVWRIYEGKHEAEFLSDTGLVGFKIGSRSYLLNSSLNPWVYGIFNSKFRQYYYRALCCRN